MTVISGADVEAVTGNCLPLERIPLGMQVHNIELNVGAGGTLVRGAGAYAQLMAKDGKYVTIKLPSGETKMILGKCYATIGALSNMEKRNTRLGKAGRNRYRGVRPHVRGVAMANPEDHPHAGSYRDNGIGMPSPKSPWGWKTRGPRTRRRTRTNYSIVKSRHSK
jgi:large subunit ribosomal protein L2